MTEKMLCSKTCEKAKTCFVGMQLRQHAEQAEKEVEKLKTPYKVKTVTDKLMRIAKMNGCINPALENGAALFREKTQIVFSRKRLDL